MAQLVQRDCPERFRLAFAAAPVAVALVAAEGPRAGRFLEINPEFARLFGYLAHEMVDVSIEDVTHADDLAVTADMFRRLATRRVERIVVEKRYVRRDGIRFWGSLYASRVASGDDDEPAFVVAHVREVTDRKQAELELLRRTGQLEESQRLANIGSFELKLETGEFVWSDQMFRILGLDPGSPPLTFREYAESVHPADRSRVEPAGGQLRYPQAMEYRFSRGDGRTIVLHVTTSPVKDDAGRTRALIGTVQDVTAPRSTEAALRAAERFETAFDVAPTALLLVGIESEPGPIQYANAACVAVTGREPEQLVGHELTELFPQRVLPPGLATLAEAPTTLAEAPTTRFDEHVEVLHTKRGRLRVRARAHIVPVRETERAFLHLDLQEEIASGGGEPSELSKREREILEHVAAGRGGAEIAAQLHLSAETVKTHLRRVYLKLGVNDRAAAVAVAMRRRIIG